MKRIVILVCSMALCLAMAACSTNQALKTDDSNDKVSPSASAAVPDAPTNKPADSMNEAPEGAEKPSEKLVDMYQAYADALDNLGKNHIFPDGDEAAELTGDMAENKFVLYDVDNDGEAELLLMYNSTYMAGQVGYVFGCDAETKILQTELSEFPFLTFYENGIIKAGWSHNQGRAGDSFWPYSLYQYAPETDSYILVAMVDAWDKNYPGADDGNPFPSDIDKSGTGLVYYIMEDGEYDTTHPVDATAYNAWINSFIGSASEIEIQYTDLTEENISQIRNIK